MIEPDMVAAVVMEKDFLEECLIPIQVISRLYVIGLKSAMSAKNAEGMSLCIQKRIRDKKVGN
ncbi:MAG: hypothetical protein Q4P16_01405 [Spirochaetales bacterium]|nr:hypothetical protein [Spirochaetales bacterium]